MGKFFGLLLLLFGVALAVGPNIESTGNVFFSWFEYNPLYLVLMGIFCIIFGTLLLNSWPARRIQLSR